MSDRKKHFAIKAMEKYDEALIKNFKDDVLRVKLLSNRSYCNLLLRNFGNTIIDCKFIIEKLDNTFLKAYFRCASALLELERLQECVEICRKGLEQHSNAAMLKDIKTKAQARIKKLKEKKQRLEMMKRQKLGNLLQKLSQENILLGEKPTIQMQAIYQKKMRVEDKVLKIPIVFIYPQFGQFDIVEDCTLEGKLIDAVRQTIGEGLPWDSNKEYDDFGQMDFYLELDKQCALNEFRKAEDIGAHRILKLDKLVIVNQPLKKILNVEGLVLPRALEIVVVSTKSNFHAHFVENFQMYLK